MVAARAAGATLTARFGHIVWQVEGIEQQRRARTVAELLSRLDGVLEAQATASGALRVEFDRGVIDEARIESVLIPLGELPRRYQELDLDQEIVLHCKMGGRSAKAQDFLRTVGVTNTKNLKGGVLAWIDQVDPSQPKY